MYTSFHTTTHRQLSCHHVHLVHIKNIVFVNFMFSRGIHCYYCTVVVNAECDFVLDVFKNLCVLPRSAYYQYFFF